MAHGNSSDFNHPDEMDRFYTHKSEQNNYITHADKQLYFHYAWQFVFLMTVITGFVHRNASHNRAQWRHRAPPDRPEAKLHRAKQGQGGGFTGKFRATPALLQATSFLSRSHWFFLGPQLSFSGHISPFLGHAFSFQFSVCINSVHSFSH